MLIDGIRKIFTGQNKGHLKLIAINVIVFLSLGILYVMSSIGKFNEVFAFVEAQFSLPPTLTVFLTRPWTIITYAFWHSPLDIFHILFNMLTLYWFGSLLSNFIGGAKVISIYILGALVGGVLYLIAYNTIPFYMERSGFSGMIGASGAVYALMTASATLLPNYSFHLLFFGSVRIVYIALFYILISFLGSVGANAGGNVAHLGGALLGFFYIKSLQRGVNIGLWINAILDTIASSFRRRSRIRVTHKNPKPAGKKISPQKDASSASQEEIDAILDKISAGGYESLTREEKTKLFNASKN